MRTYQARIGDEQGMALLGVLLMLILISALCATLAVSGRTETLAASNQETAAQARGVAEAGLNHAAQVVIANLSASALVPSAAMTALLVGPDGLTGTAAADADNGSLEALCVAPNPCIPRLGLGTLGLNGLPGVSYEARLFDEDDPARGLTLSAVDVLRIAENTQPLNDANEKIIVRATGYGRSNTRTTLEAIIGVTKLPAIVTNGNLELNGAFDIQGTNGSVHSNGDLTIVGDSGTVSVNVTSSGVVTGEEGNTIGGYTAEGQGTLTVPNVQASDHLSKAQVVLNNDGTVTAGPAHAALPSGTVLCTTPPPNNCQALYGWSYDGGGDWSIGGGPSGGLDNTFYVEGNASISSSPTATMGIIAEGNIVITGNADLTPPAHGYLFVTDRDLRIQGNFATPVTIEGRVLVREQMSLSGNPVIAGQMLVQDASNLSSEVTANEISGNVTVVNNGLGGIGAFAVGGWREVR